MFASDAIFHNIAVGMIIWGVFVFVTLLFSKAEYGRYSKDTGYFINGKLAWFIQELPSLLVPLLMLYYTESPLMSNMCNKILFLCFITHYIHR